MRKGGMNNPAYFFDTYAFFEIIRGNPEYAKYADAQAITAIFNLAELNYNLKKEKGKKIADAYTDKYRAYIAAVTVEDIKEAMDLKVKKKSLSIPDAVGYTIARKYGVRFLTGDEDFRGMPGIEFVK